MKKTNLITVIMLVLLMLTGITANAETSNTDPDYIKGRFYLDSFGIDTSELEYDSPVTRGFAA
ncbi:MAG: hypothetical protein IJ460_03390, partial [Clostridia bacterium]|nr:hypothetical protein [Clostridia bacterium]